MTECHPFWVDLVHYIVIAHGLTKVKCKRLWHQSLYFLCVCPHTVQFWVSARDMGVSDNTQSSFSEWTGGVSVYLMSDNTLSHTHGHQLLALQGILHPFVSNLHSLVFLICWRAKLDQIVSCLHWVPTPRSLVATDKHLKFALFLEVNSVKHQRQPTVSWPLLDH